LFANFRKKGHVRPDVVVKLRARSGEPQFAVFHGEFEGEYRQVIEKRLKMYFHQLALEYDDPPVITAAIFKTGRVCGIEQREVVREVGSWVSNRFYYLAFGLSQSLAEQYVNRPQPLAAALAALMGSELWDRVEQKLQCLEAVGRAEVDDEKRYLLAKVVDVSLELNDEENTRFTRELEQGKRKEVQKMVLTWQEALAESDTQGEARGRTRGRVEEAREAVVLVVRSKWGSPPNGFVARLEAIDDLDRLHEIMEQALNVHSLDEIELDA
ncbi:MAG: hypothetical protein GY856_35540, partial [bacterium]|nr:hypothetical protein [bacterium]